MRDGGSVKQEICVILQLLRNTMLKCQTPHCTAVDITSRCYYVIACNRWVRIFFAFILLFHCKYIGADIWAVVALHQLDVWQTSTPGWDTKNPPLPSPSNYKLPFLYSQAAIIYLIMPEIFHQIKYKQCNMYKSPFGLTLKRNQLYVFSDENEVTLEHAASYFCC